jgi:hypothetical protein
MIIQLRGQAQELLDQTELVVITERVDDVALLLAQSSLQRRKGDDAHGPARDSGPAPAPSLEQQGLSWGWTAVIWLAYILSEGNHRKVTVETYVRGMKQTLGRITAQPIRVLDLRDDRLAHLLKHLSKAKY